MAHIDQYYPFNVSHVLVTMGQSAPIHYFAYGIKPHIKFRSQYFEIYLEYATI